MSVWFENEDVFALLENTREPKDVGCLLFQSPVDEIYCTQAQHFKTALRRLDALKHQGYYLCGYVSYEAGYLVADKKDFTFNTHEDNHHPLLHFYAFKNCTRIRAQDVTNILDEQHDSSELPVAIQNIQLNLAKQDYLEQIAKVQEHIGCGDTYQVNFTQKYRFEYQGEPLSLYRHLRQRQTVEFGAFLNFPEFKVLSLSPELFLRKSQETIMAKPMKGTCARGTSAHEETQILKAMREDTKTRSENAMIVDLLRNDLNRIAEVGSVSVTNLFEIQTFETLHQMISTVTGNVPDDIAVSHVIEQLFPCGSITGAPKIKTMQIIEALEKERRGIYTGAIGYITPENEFCFNVPIRTCIAYNDGTAELGVGGGILFDSSPQAEYEECLLKARFLTALNNSFTLFESMKYCAASQKINALPEHLARLEKSAHCLAFNIDRQQVQEAVQNAIAHLQHDHKVKVSLSQSGAMQIDCTRLETPVDPTSLMVNISDYPVDARNFLLQHKTSERALYNAEYDAHCTQGAYDVLFLNQHQVFTEGSRHNLFIKKNNVYYTPPIEAGLLPGIARSDFIKTHVGNCLEKNITPKDMIDADQILLTNAVRGVVTVCLSPQAYDRLHTLDEACTHAVFD